MALLVQISSTHRLNEPRRRHWYVGSYPGGNGEEGEGYHGPGSIMWSTKSRQGMKPLVGQNTETDEPQKRPHRCPTMKTYMRWGHKERQNTLFPVWDAELLLSSEKWTLTWEEKISHHYNLSLVSITDVREVHIYYEHDDTFQEGEDADCQSIVAGTVVVIKHAFYFCGAGQVHGALCCNGCKHHNGEQLQTRDAQRVNQVK